MLSLLKVSFFHPLINISVLLAIAIVSFVFFFFSSRRRHTRSDRDWSSDVCSSDLSSANSGTCFNTSGLQAIGHLFHANWIGSQSPKGLISAQQTTAALIVNLMKGAGSRSIRQSWEVIGAAKRSKPQRILHWISCICRSCPAACRVSNADILCAQRSRPSWPANEMMIPRTCFVAVVTIVRSESLVGLPCGPAASQNIGNPSRFKSYLPIPL